LRLRYTPRAAQELADVLDYIAEHSPQGARHVQARIKAVVDLLMRHPKAGARTSHPRLRRLVVNPYPYLVFYEVTADEIIVHGVRHAARGPDEALR
jgi:toxin ParE1/3/4